MTPSPSGCCWPAARRWRRARRRCCAAPPACRRGGPPTRAEAVELLAADGWDAVLAERTPEAIGVARPARWTGPLMLLAQARARQRHEPSARRGAVDVL